MVVVSKARLAPYHGGRGGRGGSILPFGRSTVRVVLSPSKDDVAHGQPELRPVVKSKRGCSSSPPCPLWSTGWFSNTVRFSLTVAALLIALSAATHAQARRIVSIIPATTEMLFAMGAGDRVVAVGSYDRFPLQVEKLPRVGALLDPDVERIIAMRPDLVIVYGTQAELRTQLDRAQIAYYPYTHRGLPDITQTIRLLGARVGVEAQANALADRIERQLGDIKARVAKAPRPKTLLVFSRERGSLRNIDASGGVGFLHDMLETAGGTDVLGDVKRQSVTMTTEMVLARAPEAIIELRYARDDTTDASDLQQWNALASVPAVRNKRIFMLRGEEFVVPGPRVVAATERIARTLHPEAFK
jgi:iron complex transport system substrate-binding protein